jgi:hypothetical protein
MRVATHESARSQALTDVERSRRYPDVNVSVGVQARQRAGRNQTILGLSVPLPLFDSNRGNLRESLARSAQAQDVLQATRSSSPASCCRRAIAWWPAVWRADGLTREVVPARRARWTAATRGYELGKFGFIDLLDAQRSLSQMKTQQLRACSTPTKPPPRLRVCWAMPPTASPRHRQVRVERLNRKPQGIPDVKLNLNTRSLGKRQWLMILALVAIAIIGVVLILAAPAKKAGDGRGHAEEGGHAHGEEGGGEHAEAARGATRR